MGGGTGLPNVLRGLRPLLYSGSEQAEGTPPQDRLVAIVATSDDGGSSGRLRAQFNVVPPGDIRNCLAALSDNHALIADIFQYRFDGGDGLEGHPIGNLVLTALADVTHDFAKAVEIAARVVGARGTVLPATREIVTLIAEFEDGRIVSGETAISAAGGHIAQLSLLPERPSVLPGSYEAILQADVIVAGPGSLLHQHSAAAAGSATSRCDPQSRRRPHLRRQPDDRARARPTTTAPWTTSDARASPRGAAVRLRDLQHEPDPGALAALYAAGGARPIVTGTFELARWSGSACAPIGVPLASEHPAGKIRHHPDRLAAAIPALRSASSGVWRGRAEAGGI